MSLQNKNGSSLLLEFMFMQLQYKLFPFVKNMIQLKGYATRI